MVVISEVLIYLFASVFVFELWRTITKNRKLPPGPFRWPVLGNVVEMKLANPKYPHLALASMAKKYGDVMSLGFGVHYSVVVSSYEAIKEIFRKSETSLGRYEFPFVADRAFQNNLGIIWCHGSPWREMRRFTVKALKDFGLGKTKGMESILAEESKEIVDCIEMAIQQNGGVLKIDSKSFSASAVNVLWSLVGGFRFSLDDANLERNLQNSSDIGEIVGHNNIYTVYPFLKKWFPKWSQYDRHMEINHATHDFVKEIIEKIKTTRSKRVDQSPQNLVETFIDEIEKNSDDLTSNFTEKQLIVVLMDLFFGGSETTSTALRWAILFLVLSPKVQRKLQEEISKVVQPDEPMSISDVGRIPYLRATIYEVFRMANFVPMPAARRVEVDIAFRNYVIPKGTALFMNIDLVLRDPGYWGDPETFRPERFLDDTGSKLINTERVAVFGIGKRACFGEALAWDTLSMFLITILRNFTFEVIPGNEPSAKDPHAGLTISPNTYKVKAYSRK